MKQRIMWPLILAIMAVSGIEFFIYLPSRQAQQIRSAIEETDWSKSNDQTVKEFAHEFGGTFGCSGDWCEG